jgi:hypothetical protein
MTTSPRDGQTLDLPPELVLYVRALHEPIEKYSPFFDALFIRRRNHSAFFQDLKDFRSQEHIIALLSDQSPDADDKAIYRQCSRLFLESRFAHPWCRTTPGNEGWSNAEWGKIKKQSEAKRKEEEKLHKLLVPIWCGFRVRMIPTDEQMEKFLERERKIQERLPIQLGFAQPSKKPDSSQQTKVPRQPMMREVPPPGGNAEAWVAEEDDRLYDNTGSTESSGAGTVAKLFVGVAATSWLAQNPRARKYIWKKLQKK